MLSPEFRRIAIENQAKTPEQELVDLNEEFRRFTAPTWRERWQDFITPDRAQTLKHFTGRALIAVPAGLFFGGAVTFMLTTVIPEIDPKIGILFADLYGRTALSVYDEFKKVREWYYEENSSLEN